MNSNLIELTNLRYFIYARKSSESDERQARSIADQQDTCWELAERMNLNVLDEFHESKSASQPGRTVFNQMMERIEAGEADAILAWEPSRLSRNGLDGGRIIHLLDTSQLKHLAFVNYHFSNDSHGKFNLYTAFAQSKYYSDNLRENINRGLKSRLDRGVFPNGAKRGYLNHPKTKEIVPDPDCFPLIKSMFESYAEGSISFKDLGMEMHKQGLKNNQGGVLSASQVQRMLKDPFYYGFFDYGGERYQGSHQPAISKSLYDMAQAAMKNRGKPRKFKRTKLEFAFRGLLICAECGRFITAEITKGYTYYRCTKRREDYHCQQPYIREEALSSEFESILDQLAVMPVSWIENMLAELDCLQEAQDSRKEELKAKLNGEFKKIQTKLARLADLYISGDLDRADYNARKAELQDCKAAVLERKDRLRKETAETRLEHMRKPLRLVQDLKNTPVGSDLLKIRDKVAEVGSNFELNSRKVLWVWAQPFGLLANSGAYTNWRRGWDSNPRYR